MSTFFIVVFIFVVAVVMYNKFFNEDVKRLYPEAKISEIFEAIEKTLGHHEDDHEHITDRKKSLRRQMTDIKSFFQRQPSMYTEKEITDLENFPTTIKNDLREFAAGLEKYKDSLIRVIEADKKMLDSAKIAMKASEDSDDFSDEAENAKDVMEKIIETAPERIKEREASLALLEKSISRYTSQ